MFKCMQTDFFNFHCEEKRELSARELFFQLYLIKKTLLSVKPAGTSPFPLSLHNFCSFIFLSRLNDWEKKNGSCPFKIIISWEY